MARRRTYGSRESTPKRGAPSSRSWAWLTSPLAQQALALLLIVLALLTLLTLARVTSGRWTDAWVGALQFLFGWGIVPVTAAIGAVGVLILQHHLDRPVAWRWRPVVGLELLFLSLLALTHLVAGRADSWSLVESGWGGGLVGWALAHILSIYVGPLVTAFLLLVVLLIGLGLTFDVTVPDVVGRLRRPRSPRRTPARPSPSRPAPPRETPSPQACTPAVTRSGAPPPPVKSAPPARRPAAVPAVQPEPVAFSAAALPDDLQVPSLELLDEAEPAGLSDEEVREKSRIIVDTLDQFGLPVQVVEVRRGPTVTQFGVAPGFTQRTGPNGERRPHKVRVSQIATLADDLALALAAPSLRVEAPVPGRSVVGIEVPNEEIGLVTLRSVMQSEDFRALGSPLRLSLGEDVAGSPVVADLGLMPHLLIAGTTGSGKSVCIKSMAACMAMTNRPDELRMVMIDPKMVELVRFNGLPHLLGHTEVELNRVGRVLRWVAHEMDQRYSKFAAAGARHLDDYNSRVGRRRPEEWLPRIVVLIDELADLMLLAPEETERTICRIAQMARATGIHLIVATQRPSVDVVTGLIKANFPARISFATASQVDSRVILDMPGAETLLGKGDMLYLAADAGHSVRVQGCFVSEAEVERLVEFWRRQTPGWPTEAPWEAMMREPAGGAAAGMDEDDGLLEQAIDLVRSRKTVSASFLQRQLRVGYPRAARLMEQLEEMGLVGPQQAAGRPRRVIGGEGD
jgi:S-DNA-T family DNA segregation ATPase FtsK/SpoIIIE